MKEIQKENQDVQDIKERKSMPVQDDPSTRPTLGSTRPRFTTERGEGMASQGLRIPRVFSRAGVHPYDQIQWERRTASISNDKGEVIFEQQDVEVPSSWSMLATNVVVSKYFKGGVGQPNREHSVRQLIDRVAVTITKWGRAQGYFASEADAATYEHELTYLLVNQMLSFNSPVWFNMGIEAKPQCSACFINSVTDSMGGIMDLAKTEGMLFKWGSGTGTNLSPVRSSKERLSTGGYASGPVSFMRGYDAFAGVIKSGGKTRRAAKMVILNIDHPDIVEYINCKASEEKKAWTLIQAGYDSSVNGAAYSSVFFQNSNNSVRVTDEFMRAVEEDREWSTRAVTTGETVDTYKARDLMNQIVESTWLCGDPGMQFDTTINDWHTSPNSGRINASNPCSEYMFLDDTACNLASLNLMRFRTETGEFDVASFRQAARISIIGQDIIVDNASYPTPRITQNSYDFRPLGLGYANLGALLMARGLPYDSEAGRAYAGAVTAIMHGEAYLTSALLAEKFGPFKYYPENRGPMLRVMRKHRASVDRIDGALVPPEMMQACHEVWDDCVEKGERHGYKNSQVTVLAPTGTIGFMMDCDTTGVEPDIALVKYKKLVGGGYLKIVNRTVPEALDRLGYPKEQIKDILSWIDQHETIEGAPYVKPEHLSVFDCAFKPNNGTRSIHPMGHVRMMGAAQPFLSGAISKTVNVPTDSTPDDIAKAYQESWRLGLKAVAIYRDGCKRSQPLNTSKDADRNATAARGQPERRRLPDERQSITHKFSVAGHEGYLTVGMYEDGKPGEIFIKMAKEGSTISGLMDSVATTTSIALQYGVPIKVLVDKFCHTRFEPSGYTNNPQIPIAKSIMDYVFRYLAIKFVPAEAPEGVEAAVDGAVTAVVPAKPSGNGHAHKMDAKRSDAPTCSDCGAIMVPNGACYKCVNCGGTSGCS